MLGEYMNGLGVACLDETSEKCCEEERVNAMLDPFCHYSGPRDRASTGGSVI